MLDELKPMGLTDAARSLGVDPFEVVRLMVAGDSIPANGMQVNREQIESLRALGRIETSWWDGVDLPEDPNPLRQRVRAAIHLITSREHTSQNPTRMDNVWRGLPYEDQALLQGAITALAEAGHLRISASSVGLFVAADDASLPALKKLAAGTTDLPALTALYEG